MKKAALVILVVFVLVALVYLLKPVPEGARWDITTDMKALAAKQQFLQSVRQQHAPVSGKRPNVIFILADDLGKYDVSLYRNFVQPAPPSFAVKVETPNIDALGKQGIVYRNAYVTAPICGPSRAGLLTGRYQNRFGFETQPMQRYVRNNLEYLWFRHVIDTNEMRPVLYANYPKPEMLERQGLPVSEITLADLFSAAGYHTGIMGKWHVGYGAENHPMKFGFDHQYGFIEAFSLYAPEGDPDVVSYHQPLFAEEHIWNQQRKGPSAITRNGVVIDEKRYLTDALVDETEQFIHEATQKQQPFFAYVAFNAVHTPFQARKEDYNTIANAPDDNHRVYLAMIKRLDYAVGELTGYLQKQGLADNTLVIFSSDNGGAMYTGAMDNAPLRGGKLSQFEGGLEVPMILCWPGHLAPGEVQPPVMLTDIFATAAGLLGTGLPQDRVYDGTNLLASEVEQVLSERPLFWRSEYNRAVRYHQWKLVQNTREHTLRLFDLDKDPGEKINVAARQPEVVRDLLQKLDQWERGLQPARWPRVMDFHLRSEGEDDWFAI